MSRRHNRQDDDAFIHSNRPAIKVERIVNQQGSTAGSGSGEFYQYRLQKRREKMQEAQLYAEDLESKKKIEIEQKQIIREINDDLKTSKRRDKRDKKKEKKKSNILKKKIEKKQKNNQLNSQNKKSSGEDSDSDLQEDQNEQEDQNIKKTSQNEIIVQNTDNQLNI